MSFRFYSTHVRLSPFSIPSGSTRTNRFRGAYVPPVWCAILSPRGKYQEGCAVPADEWLARDTDRHRGIVNHGAGKITRIVGSRGVSGKSCGWVLTFAVCVTRSWLPLCPPIYLIQKARSSLRSMRRSHNMAEKHGIIILKRGVGRRSIILSDMHITQLISTNFLFANTRSFRYSFLGRTVSKNPYFKGWPWSRKPSSLPPSRSIPCATCPIVSSNLSTLYRHQILTSQVQGSSSQGRCPESTNSQPPRSTG